MACGYDGFQSCLKSGNSKREYLPNKFLINFTLLHIVAWSVIITLPDALNDSARSLSHPFP